jgi:hypothetical protein
MNVDFVLKVIKLFSSDIKLEFTILDISKKSKLSYNAAHRTVQALMKRGVLSIRKIGPVSLVSLVKNTESYGYLVLANASDKNSEEELVEEVNKVWNQE